MKSLRYVLAPLAAALLFAGCASDVKLDEPAPVESRSAVTVDPNAPGGRAGGAAAGMSSQSQVANVDLSKGDAAANGLAKTIYFDYDSFVVKDEFRPTVEQYAKLLNADRKRRLKIEGHTDERGGREYNLALGQKRAESVQKALSLLGVADTQVEAVSYGKERPAMQGTDEAAFAKNRRAELIPEMNAATFARPLLACAIALGSAVPAHAGLFDDEEARKAILDLRDRISRSDDQNRQRMEQQNAAHLEQLNQIKRSLLELNNGIEALRTELAKLRGNDEQLARDIAELQRRQKDIAQGVEERMRKMEPVKVTLDGRDFLADPEEKRQFDEAMAVLRSGDFAAATNAFTAFTRRYPSSGFTDAARFWLGNAQYGKREYNDSITTLRSFASNAPEHPRAPEALLAIANSQLELKDRAAARKTLDELLKTYPQSEAALAGRDRLASLR